jgi:hypothetical protein
MLIFALVLEQQAGEGYLQLATRTPWLERSVADRNWV